MRDWLPHESETQGALAQRVLSTFELFGYQRVIVPVFEYAAVLEKGTGGTDSDALLRFVEPETGEVLALRSDLTPQVARLVATRLRDLPCPARLCYQGSVLRRRQERARQHRQIPQVGIELVGREGPEGDLEVLRAAVAAVRAAGLSDFVLDIGHARIVGALLDELPESERPALIEALLLKDARSLAARARAIGVPRPLFEALSALPSLHGDKSIWPRAEALLGATKAAPFVAELRRLADVLEQSKLSSRVLVDLGETRNFEYYTGPMFQILAEGPGEPVGSGGRYDGLLTRFGLEREAAGFALNLDNLGWAVERSGGGTARRLRVLIEENAGNASALADALRGLGVACARHPSEGLLTYAAAWGYTHLVKLGPGGARVESLADGVVNELQGGEADLAAAIARVMAS